MRCALLIAVVTTAVAIAAPADLDAPSDGIQFKGSDGVVQDVQRLCNRLCRQAHL
jgi:hypothetical protein